MQRSKNLELIVFKVVHSSVGEPGVLIRACFLQELRTRAGDLPDASHPYVRTCLKKRTTNPGRKAGRSFATDKQPSGEPLETLSLVWTNGANRNWDSHQGIVILHSLTYRHTNQPIDRHTDRAG